MESFVDYTIEDNVALLTLNRSDKRNALNGPFVAELKQKIAHCANDQSRVLLIVSRGDHFCAGGDIAWMQKMVEESEDKNYQDAQSLADLLYQLYHFPKPTIALIQGAALGGGLGLVCACDIAMAANNASFGLPEVKIGLAPSVISPYVLRAVGERLANFYFLTGEKFGADEAYRVGLIQQITEPHALQKEGLSLAKRIASNQPHALIAAKALLRRIVHEKITERLVQMTAEHLAELRSSKEGQAGLRAFLEKGKT